MFVCEPFDESDECILKLNCSVQSFDNLNCRDEVKRAIITWDGELTQNYKYIEELRREKRYKKTLNCLNNKQIDFFIEFLSFPTIKFYYFFVCLFSMQLLF